MRFRNTAVMLLLISGCAPSLVSQEGWVRSFLRASSSSRERACDKGVQKARARESLSNYGYVHPLSQGELRFASGFSSSFIACYAAILNNQERPFPAPAYETFIVVESPIWKLDDISAQIELEDVKNMPLATISFKSKKCTSNDCVFNFNNLTNTDLENIDKAEGFSVIVNIGKNQERVRVAKNDVLGF